MMLRPYCSSVKPLSGRFGEGDELIELSRECFKKGKVRAVG